MSPHTVSDAAYMPYLTDKRISPDKTMAQQSTPLRQRIWQKLETVS